MHLLLDVVHCLRSPLSLARPIELLFSAEFMGSCVLFPCRVQILVGAALSWGGGEEEEGVVASANAFLLMLLHFCSFSGGCVLKFFKTTGSHVSRRGIGCKKAKEPSQSCRHPFDEAAEPDV